MKSLSCVQLFATPWTVAYQAPPSMGFSRQGYLSGVPFPSPGDLPNWGIKPGSPALQADSLLSEPPGKPILKIIRSKTYEIWTSLVVQGWDSALPMQGAQSLVGEWRFHMCGVTRKKSQTKKCKYLQKIHTPQYSLPCCLQQRKTLKRYAYPKIHCSSVYKSTRHRNHLNARQQRNG